MDKSVLQKLDKLFRHRILALPASEQLIEENSAFETMMAAAPNPLHCEHLKTEEEWLAFRTVANEGSEAGAFLPENLKAWMRKGNARAENITITGPAGDLEIRMVEPEGEVRGALLHTHGGGWIMGTPKQFDCDHAMAADLSGLLVAAPNYRKAPQCPYPAAQDDCEAAALWLIDYGRQRGIERFFVQGKSAGGHLATATAIRMKHKHDFRFDGVVSEVPLHDFSNGLPSRKSGFGVDGEACRQMSNAYIPDVNNKRIPDASPLFFSNADLADLPAALFSCGERDGFRDDALLMFMRWVQAGNNAYLLVANGVGHNLTVTNAVGSVVAQQAPIEFFNRCLSGEIQ